MYYKYYKGVAINKLKKKIKRMGFLGAQSFMRVYLVRITDINERQLKNTFSMVSITIFLYCSFSSFKSSTILLMISDAPTLLANSTVVSTSYKNG